MGLVRAYGIETVVDVRRFPTSNLEHFKKGNFEKFLIEAGIKYLHMGEHLGGYRKGGYEAYTLTEGFLAGLNGLEGAALKEKTLFVCAERLPWRCHRRFIGQRLQERGWQVVHIIEKGRTWNPKGE